MYSICYTNSKYTNSKYTNEFRKDTSQKGLVNWIKKLLGIWDKSFRDAIEQSRINRTLTKHRMLDVCRVVLWYGAYDRRIKTMGKLKAKAGWHEKPPA